MSKQRKAMGSTKSDGNSDGYSDELKTRVSLRKDISAMSERAVKRNPEWADGLIEAGSSKHSQEAEDATLGGILINPDAFFEVKDFLYPDDFYVLRNNWIFEAMTRLHERGESVDFLLVTEELKAQGRLDDIGGSAYLTYLAANTATSVHTEAYGRVVKHAAIRRRGQLASIEANNLFLDEDRSVTVIEDDVFNLYREVFAEVPTRNEPTRQEISDDAEQRLFFDDEQPTISFGIREVDRVCGRAMQGDLICILGRTGMGKSRYVSSRAVGEASAGKRVLFMTTEEAPFQTWYRLIEIVSNGVLKVRDMRAKTPIRNSEHKRDLYVECDLLLGGLPIDIVRVNEWHIHQIVRRIRQQQYDLVIVDHLHNLGMTPTSVQLRYDQELALRMETLKNAALRHETVIMVPAQVKPASENKAVYTSADIKESDAAGEKPDIILGLHRPNKGGGAASISLGKTRWGDGDGRVIPAYFDLEAGVFTDARPSGDGQISVQLDSIF